MKKLKPIAKLKKKPKTRVRRNPYSRALDQANKRWDAAVREFQRCQTRMDALSIEIPKLDQMRQVLGQYLEKGSGGSPAELQTLMDNIQVPPMTERIQSNPLPLDVSAAIPDHLRRFIKDHPSIERGSLGKAGGAAMRVGFESSDDDAFLPNPGGQELLP